MQKNQQLKVKKAPPQTFGWVLNTALGNIVKK